MGIIKDEINKVSIYFKTIFTGKRKEIFRCEEFLTDLDRVVKEVFDHKANNGKDMNIMELRVKQSSAINMVGAYLSSEAICPVCGKNNILLHTESYLSPVKFYSELICEHLIGREVDEDYLGADFIFNNL